MDANDYVSGIMLAGGLLVWVCLASKPSGLHKQR